MERRSDDPAYQIHDNKPPERERGGPRTDAAGQEDREERSENSSLESNRRLNAEDAPPSQVRETEREHDSPNAPRDPDL